MLKYPDLDKDKLADELDKSRGSVHIKVQRLNLSRNYDKKAKAIDSEIDLKEFCRDCTKDPESCDENIMVCINKAETYTRFHNLNINEITKNAGIEKRKVDLKERRVV